jgi:nucleoside-diphosphate-sugar epimerase
LLNVKNILVTGGSGFLGTHLVTALSSLGLNVIQYCYDIRDPIELDQDIDVVFHLAAVTSNRVFQEKPHYGYSVNVLSTLNILEFCKKKNALLVFTSTCGVYSSCCSGPIKEDFPIQSRDPYSHSKYLAEQICSYYSNNLSVRCVVLRLFNVFGHGQPDYFLISYLINRAKSGEEILLKSPHSVRDFIYVSDVVQALINAACYKDGEFNIFNIGSGAGIKVIDILKCIEQISKKKVKYKTDSKYNDSFPVAIADISNSKEELGWKPEITLLEGLRKTLFS